MAGVATGWWVLLAVGVLASVHPATTAVVRWADGRAVRQPWRPRCVTDDHDLAVSDVVPVWSWIARRGRCRTCEARIPGVLPLVEVAVVVVLAAVAWRHPGPGLVLLLPIAWSAVVATPIDLAERIIPNRLTYPLAAWSLVSATGLAAAYGAWADWRRALLVGFALPAGMEVLSLLFLFLRGERGMGLGDVKWALSLGVAVGLLGADAVLLFLVGTIVAAGLVSIVLLATGRAGSARIPFGPYLALGTITALVAPSSWLTRALA